MDLSSFAPPHLSFVKCIVELVLNSLKANASCIAIRIHDRKRTFHVIDNGMGITRRTISTLGEHQLDNLSNFNSSEKHILSRIKRLADAMSVTSRTSNSNTTYRKEFRTDEKPEITEAEFRPSCGTTISIYGFYDISPSKWDWKTMYYTIGSIALNCPNVSFSIRDDKTRKVTLALPKSRRPISVLKKFYRKDILKERVWFISNESSYYSCTKFAAFIGLSRKLPAKQYVFLNNKPIKAPQILQCITSIAMACADEVNRESIFILLFVTSTRYSFSLEDGLILPNLCHLIEVIRKCLIEKCIGIQLISTTSSTKVMCVGQMTNQNYQRGQTCGEPAIVSDFPKPIINELSLLHVDMSASKLSTVKSHKNQRHLVKTVEIVNKKITQTEIVEKGEKRQSDISKLQFDYLDQLCGFISPNPKRMKKTITHNFTLSFSQLSDWSYHSNQFHREKQSQKHTQKKPNMDKNSRFSIRKRFVFLPPKLNAMVPNTNKKLITLKSFSGSDMSIISLKRKFGLRGSQITYYYAFYYIKRSYNSKSVVSETLNHQELNVRPCKAVKKFSEFRFNKSHLNSLQVLGQICNEVIAGLISHKEMKVLLLIDQHAIHERIRYEDLLNKYTSFGRKEFLSIKLKEPIIIDMSNDTYDLVMFNKDLLQKYGIKLSSLKQNTVIIHCVPECIKKNKYYHDDARIKMNVQSLLNEVLQNFEKSCPLSVLNLPVTLQNSIAAEACHGAIKFGDQLSLEQCKSLVELLKRTKIPTQCAHGRPSIIPMLDLSNWDRSQRKIMQKKLNFGRLKLHRRRM